MFEIIVCFIPSRKHDESVSVMALHSDCKTVLGPWVHVGSDATMIRMLTYLGATREQIAEYEDCRRRWGQGSANVSVLGANRKNLLRIDWSKLEK